MIMRRVYDFQILPSGESYEPLLRLAASFASTAGVIIRSQAIRLHQSAESTMNSLRPHLLTVNEVTAWPGTQLVGGSSSTRYLYRLIPESLAVLVRSASSLFEWVNPHLPEDLHFLREDGSTVLTNIAQHDDAWLELSDEEVKRWRTQAPKELREAIREHDSAT